MKARTNKIVVGFLLLSVFLTFGYLVLASTVTYNTKTSFNGTKNRITDVGSADASPQLESYYQEIVPDINTVALWHMNEGSGNVADSSGNGNTGTPTGTSVVSGKFGNARSFNGVSDYIQIGSRVTPLGAKTYEFWIKTTHPTGGTTRAMFDNLGGTSANHGDAFSISSGKIYWASYKGVGGDDRFIVSGNTLINDGNWHHIAGTWDGTTNSNAVKVYVDGVQDATGTADSTESTTQSFNLRIGASNEPSGYFPGTLDEVRISNVARSPEEIKAHADRKDRKS